MSLSSCRPRPPPIKPVASIPQNQPQLSLADQLLQKPLSARLYKIDPSDGGSVGKYICTMTLFSFALTTASKEMQYRSCFCWIYRPSSSSLAQNCWWPPDVLYAWYVPQSFLNFRGLGKDADACRPVLVLQCLKCTNSLHLVQLVARKLPRHTVLKVLD